MTYESSTVLWIEARSDYTVHELSRMSGLSVAVLDELIESGVLPTTETAPTVAFAAESVALARAASRLREHFELDREGLAVAVSLLRRVRTLEHRLAAAGLAR